MMFMVEFIRSYFTRFFYSNETNLQSPQRKYSESYPEIIGFGNVLLDLSIKIVDTTILDKYGLCLNCEGELKSKVLSEILFEIKEKSNLTVNRNAGGSTLNTVRILNKLNNKNVKFFGAIGNDETGKMLNNILMEDDINFSFQIIPSVPSGQCLCLIYDDKSALYANIGASQFFTKEFLEISENEFLNTNQFQIYYIEGFFIPHRQEVCKHIVNNYICDNKLLAINLNGSYIIKENLEIVKFLFNHSTIIFGNKAQYITLVEEFGYKNIVDLVENLFTSKKRQILIITDGDRDVECYSNYVNGYVEINYVPVPKINSKNIVDTTGAGDSFVAGFLELFLEQQPLTACILNGCAIAGKVITQIGCNLPD